MFGNFFDYDEQCDCGLYKDEERRRMDDNETDVERLLDDVERYDEWEREEKIVYHEFIIKEVTAMLKG